MSTIVFGKDVDFSKLSLIKKRCPTCGAPLEFVLLLRQALLRIMKAKVFVVLVTLFFGSFIGGILTGLIPDSEYGEQS